MYSRRASKVFLNDNIQIPTKTKQNTENSEEQWQLMTKIPYIHQPLNDMKMMILNESQMFRYSIDKPGRIRDCSVWTHVDFVEFSSCDFTN